MTKYFLPILFVCIICWCSCTRDDSIYSVGSTEAISASQILKITQASPIIIPADGATVSLITLKITPDADSLNKVITLSTNLGTFLNGQATSTIIADAYGNAQFAVRSGQAGTATITAKVKSVIIDTTIKFIQALPEDFLFTSDKYVLDTTQSATLTVTLNRNPGNGSITDPAKVYFTLSSSPTSSQLILPPYAFSVNGISTIAVTNPLKLTGSFMITAKTSSPTGDTLRKSLTLLIK